MDKLLICFLLTVSISKVFSGNFLLYLNLENSIAFCIYTVLYIYSLLFYHKFVDSIGALAIITNDCDYDLRLL